MEDLAAVPMQGQWSEPIHTRYRGYDVYSNPATTRGGLEVLMQLNLIEHWDVGAMGAGSAQVIHLQAGAQPPRTHALQSTNRASI